MLAPDPLLLPDKKLSSAFLKPLEPYQRQTLGEGAISISVNKGKEKKKPEEIQRLCTQTQPSYVHCCYRAAPRATPLRSEAGPELKAKRWAP